jgi:hypothetical protein
MRLASSEQFAHHSLPIGNTPTTATAKISEKKSSMEKCIKILIMDDDCSRLAALVLWLDQFREFQVSGVLANSDSCTEERLLSDCQIILLGDNAIGAYNRFLEKSLKVGSELPSIIGLKTNSANGHEGELAFEYEVIVNVDASLKDLYDQIGKVATRRKNMFSPGWLLTSKAS